MATASKSKPSNGFSIISEADIVRSPRGRKSDPLDQDLVDFLATLTAGNAAVLAPLAVTVEEGTDPQPAKAKVRTRISRHMAAAQPGVKTRLDWSIPDSDGRIVPQVRIPAPKA